MLPTISSPATRRGAQAGAIALALLLTTPTMAWADGGTRHGGARRQPPPAPAWVGEVGGRGARPQAPSAARNVPSTSGQATTYVRQSGALPNTFQRPSAARSLPAPSSGQGLGGVRAIQPGQAPRYQRTLAPTPQTLPQVRSLPAPTATAPRPLRTPLSAPSAAGSNAGLRRPLAGTSASPTWDSRRLSAPAVRSNPQVGLPATPRAGVLRSSTPLATSPYTAPYSGGVRRGSNVAAQRGLMAPSRSTAFTGTSGAGVHYGGRPSASGFYGYPRRHWHGHGIGHGWYGPSYPSAPYYPDYGYYGGSGLTLSIGLLGAWGFGSGCCEPAYSYAPAWPVQGPGWVVQEPAYPLPYEVQPGYAPYAPQAPGYAAPQAMPPVGPEPAPQPLPPSDPGMPGTWPEPSSPAPAPEAPPEAGQDPAQPAPLSAADEQALTQSVEEFRAGRYGAAQATLEGLAARTPQLGHAWLGIAHAAFAMDRYQRSSEALTKAALLGAFPRGYAFDPRALYAKPEDFLGRKQALEQHVGAKPNDADARLVLAWLRMSLGERDLARADLDAVLRLRPADEAAPMLSFALLPPAPEASEPAPQPAQPPVPGVR